MIKLAISGCQGKMGQRIIDLALRDKDFAIQTLLEHPQHPKISEKIHDISISTDNAAIKDADVLIEFTSPEATLKNLKACVEYGTKMVIGTTGLKPDQIEQIQASATKIPIVFSANMSVGVNIVFKLTEITAGKGADSYQANIEEAHHIHKKDAPSGTAKTLAQIIETASGKNVKDINSIREGEIVGDHKIVFESAEDIITISHHAKSRDIFVRGALLAAKFLADKQEGLFNMQNVLGIE